MKKFDLNIDKILDNWEVEHAIREIIANAIDEQKLTGSQNIVIEKLSYNSWSIKDFGRGIKYEHFVQNENVEKQNTNGIIGKFGIGLKDALATFDRKGVSVQIFSKHGDIRVRRFSKGDFNDIVTLHAIIDVPSRPNMIGTEFVLTGITDDDIRKAKDYFLFFSNTSTVLSSTKLGEIIEKKPEKASSIYVNGVKIASEDDFLFSYNITTLSPILKKSLNRERSNVGRSAYTPSIKAMLLESENAVVIDKLAEDIKNLSNGTNHDELKWQDVQLHATQVLSKREKVVFVTSHDIIEHNDIIHEMERNSQVVVIPEKLNEKIAQKNEQIELENREIEERNEKAIEENKEQVIEPKIEQIKTFNVFTKERSANFEFSFVDESMLTQIEYNNFKCINKILDIIGGKPANVREILISETMQNDNETFAPAIGLWRGTEGRIIIKRSQLNRLEDFIGTFLHELAHAKSGYTDSTRGFEKELTNMLGVLGARFLRNE